MQHVEDENHDVGVRGGKMRFVGRFLCGREGGRREMHLYGFVYSHLALTSAHD